MILNIENYNFIPFNIRDYENSFFNNIECEVIINLASINPKSINKNYINGNCLIAENIVKVARKINCKRIINISAMSIFNGITNGVVSNKTIPIPLDLYSVSKLMMENIFVNSKLEQVINIRLPGVFFDEDESSILSRTIRNIKNNTDISYYNPKSKFNNVINVDNLYFFISKLLKFENKNRVNYNLGANNPLLIIDLLELLIIKFSSQSKLIHDKTNSRNSFYIDLESENKVYKLSNLIDYI